MEKKALTDLSIKKLRAPEDGRLERSDGKFPGLSLRVTKNGVKTFALRTRVHGQMVRVSLGRYPDISLSKARQLAYHAVAEAKAGREPRIGRSKIEPIYRFDRVVEEYQERHGRRFQKARTFRETQRILRVEFVSRWGARDVRKITKQDVVTLINDILLRPQLDGQKRVVRQESPSAANHAYECIRAFFNWCVGQGKIDLSPCVGLRKPAPKKSRDRTLTERELASVWQAATKIGYPYGDIIRLLIATAQRRGEVAGLRWEMVDLSDQVWRVPGEENKSGRDYLVPLTDLAMEIIDGIPRLD